MLIKIVAMFRNLLISSFDATIRVKRAFHPALASRGFASHVFLVIKNNSSRSEVNKFVGPSGAKPREFERKIYLYIYVYIYIVEGVRNVAWQQ